MLTPRRLNTPVLVLDRHITRRGNLTTSLEPNGQRREGLVEGDGGHQEQSSEMMRGNNETATTGQEEPRTTPQASQIPLAPPSPGLLATSRTSLPTPPTTHTVSVQSTPSAAAVPAEDERVEIEPLPGQNQHRPNLDDTSVEAEALPGINQDTSNLGELPKPAPPVGPANPKEPSAVPAITVNRPLPGQNQADPIKDEIALSSAPPSATPPPPLPALVNSSIPGPVTFSEPMASSVSSTANSVVPSASSISPQASFAVSSGAFVPSFTSFVTITRAGQDKEEAPTTLASSSTTSSPVISSSVSPADSATPQAIAVAQSISGILSSTAAIATITLTPAPVSSNQQDGNILHPTTRTLLILFVVLGALSILIAIVVFMMIKSHRKRTRAQQHAMLDQSSYDASSDRIGITTHISANPNDNPFLTASEKAIIDRAALPDSTSSVDNSSSISEAISSFIKKSRRLTYKISP